MINKIRFSALLLSAFFVFTLSAQADVAADPGASTTPQPFSFYCAPYTDPFVEGGSYAPTHNGTCFYTIPQTRPLKMLETYRGVIGNATQVASDITIGTPLSSLRTTPNSFGTSNNPGDHFFTVSYSTFNSQQITDAQAYLQTGAGTPPDDLTSLSFIWAGDESQPGDTSAPVIEINTPLNGENYLQSQTIFIATNVTDASPIANTTYKLNGTLFDGDAAVHLSDYPLGSATLVVAATDSVGNTGYATSTFTIVSPDSVAPQVVINTPANGSSHLQSEIILIDTTLTDSSEIATTTYKINGVGIDGSSAMPLTSFPLGGATLVVSATDSYGNKGYATSTFTIVSPDLIPPTVTITSPAQGGQYFNTASLFATANITDASPIIATSYSFNGVEIDQSQPLPLLSAPLGLATVSVSATDAYGNAASTTVTFTLKAPDTTAPTIVITNPIAGNTYLNTASIIAAATITDSSGVASSAYELNGLPINPANPLPISTLLGSAKLTVFATDTFNNTSSSTVYFTIKKALTITADNKVVLYHASIPPLTSTITGFVSGETLATSGVTGTQLCTTTATASSPVGNYPITCTIGTLASGRYAFTNFVAGTLAVQYKWDGFEQPINDTAHQIGQDLSVFKGGSTVPVKLQLKDASGTVVSGSSVVWLPPQKGVSMNQPIDETVYSDPGTAGNNFAYSGGHYQFNWKTDKNQSGYWWRIFALLPDGTIQSVTIGLR